MNELDRFIRELKRQSRDESYWRAVEKTSSLHINVPGTTVNGFKVQTGPEIPETQSDAIDKIALGVTPVGETRPSSEVLNSMSAPDHMIHFCTPEEQSRETLAYLEQGLRSDAKIVSIQPVDQLEPTRDALHRKGHGRELRSGKISFVPMEELRDRIVSENSIKATAGFLGELLEKASAEGYPEVKAVGTIAGALFSRGEFGLTREIESWWHWQVYARPMSLYCPYPVESLPADFWRLRTVVAAHNWLTCGREAYPIELALTRPAYAEPSARGLENPGKKHYISDRLLCSEADSPRRRPKKNTDHAAPIIATRRTV